MGAMRTHRITCAVDGSVAELPCGYWCRDGRHAEVFWTAARYDDIHTLTEGQHPNLHILSVEEAPEARPPASDPWPELTVPYLVIFRYREGGTH